MNERVLLSAAVVTVALAFGPASAGAAPATDGPGAMSHFDLARKDCVGTARNDRSKVWFTVADGVLSDVYYPTNDNTENETLQYVVTDGSTFTDLQTRDMTYSVQALDSRALTCRVTAKAKSGRYRIVTDYLTDPDRPTVILHSRFEALRGRTKDYRVYVRFDPTLNGNGGGAPENAGADGGTVARDRDHTLLIGSDPVTATIAANRDYAQPVYSALDADEPFAQVSNGYAGAASDGLKQLDTVAQAHRHLHRRRARQPGPDRAGRPRPPRGVHARARLRRRRNPRAVGAARGTLREPLWLTALEYLAGWHKLHPRPRRSRSARKGVSRDDWDELLDEYYLSANYVRAATDKTFAGATAAALASPWGQAVEAGRNNLTYFGSYREVFARDLYEAWTAAFLAGDKDLARDMTRFLFERQQQPDGSMPRNSLANGKPAPDTFGTQLDECSYPLIMALAVGLTGRDYYKDHIRPAANFVAAHGPTFGNERWEEQGGYSPSTISAEIAGLLAAARIADINGDRDSAAVWRGVADQFQRNLKTWTLTHQRSAQPEAVLHPALEDRRSERGDHLQRRQRRPGPRPARGHRPGLPRVRPARPDAGRRRRPRPLARRRGRDDQAPHRLRRRLPALQRRRLRGRHQRRPSVGAVEQGHRARLAGARRRARPVGAQPGQDLAPPSRGCARWPRWAPASA